MKKWIASGAIAAVAALALSAGVSAQTKPAAKAQAPAAKEHTMTGCLAKGATADTYIVTSTAEKGPKTIGIVSSKANLAPHVGHKIDITGHAVPNKEAESAKPKPPAADHYMHLTAVAMIAAKCP